MTTALETALVRLVLFCYAHERQRPGLRVVRRCAQARIRAAYREKQRRAEVARAKEQRDV